MKVTFIDLSDINYTMATPAETPLGGSQTMLCLLASWLVRRGDSVCLIGRYVPHGQFIEGVLHLEAKSVVQGRLPPTDVVIVLNNTTTPKSIQRYFGKDCKYVYWIHNDSESASLQSFAEPGYANDIDALVFVSHWQASRFIERFQPRPSRVHVVLNTVAPMFNALFAPDEPILPAKDKDLMVYASAPNRGLEALVELFPAMRSRSPGLKLEVYSGFVMDQGVYFDPQNTQKFEGLLARLSEMEGVRVTRGLDKESLALRLKRAALLCYPCVFPETSSITVLEAMAAGCRLSLSTAGGLTETAAGFAKLTTYQNGSMSGREFIENSLGLLSQMRTAPDVAETALREQVNYARQELSWEPRTLAWRGFFQSIGLE